MIRLVIFDFDDTLVSNISLDFNSFLIPCKKLKIPVPTKSEIIKYRKNNFSAKNIINDILKERKNDELTNEFIRIRKNFLENESSMKYLRLKKNTRVFLTYLRKQKISCVLCTVRKNKLFLVNFLNKRKINYFFKKIYHPEDIHLKFDNKIQAKRISMKNILIQKILSIDKLDPKKVLYIGNSIEDFIPATNYGIKFIYFQNSYLIQPKERNLIKVTTMNELKSKVGVIK